MTRRQALKIYRSPRGRPPHQVAQARRRACRYFRGARTDAHINRPVQATVDHRCRLRLPRGWLAAVAQAVAWGGE